MNRLYGNGSARIVDLGEYLFDLIDYRNYEGDVLGGLGCEYAESPNPKLNAHYVTPWTVRSYLPPFYVTGTPFYILGVLFLVYPVSI